MRRELTLRGVAALVLAIAAIGALATGSAAEQASRPSVAASGGLDVGRYHACALLPSASVRCWGYGGLGALGYANAATIGDDETPATAGPVNLGPGRTAAAVSAGDRHTCAVLDDGTVRCWGFGGDGQLGYANRNSVGVDGAPGAAGPVNLGSGRTAKAITAGGAHTCALLDNDTVRCWGLGGNGRLGYANVATIGDDEPPGSAGPVNLGLGRTAAAITAGAAHTCALLDTGKVLCWGYAGDGQLGRATRRNIGDNEIPGAPPQEEVFPVELPEPRHTALAITAGDYHTCALLDNGSVRCWGLGANGRLGYGNEYNLGDKGFVDAVTPVDLGAGRTAMAISAGGDHTCAVLDDGSVRCWGYGGNGQLGYGNEQSIGDDETPGTVPRVFLGPGRTAVAVSAGHASTCARLDDGSVRCWGEGSFGRLGYCNSNRVGDDESLGSLGPVDLGAPASQGVSCAPPPPGATVPPDIAAAVGSGPPATPAPSPRPSGPDGQSYAAALAAQNARARAFRSCLAAVGRRTAQDLRRVRRLPASKRAGPSRQAARRRASGRRACVKRHGRTPGRVSTLGAETAGRHQIKLTFRAVGTDSSRPPAARSYLVKQSRQPIRSARDFARANALCKGACSFTVGAVGATITLNVTDLRRRSTYYYAVAARDNVTARTGPRSGTVRARTR